ncbi:hypothetical protein AB0K14_05270 [Actinosynnema sp. NPDC050801]
MIPLGLPLTTAGTPLIADPTGRRLALHHLDGSVTLRDLLVDGRDEGVCA